MIHKKKPYLSIMLGLATLCFIHSVQHVTASGEDGYLEGIGYREQALQQAKGSKFQSEGADGVTMASFGGGTNIWL